MQPGRFLLGLVFILAGAVIFLVNMGYSTWAFFNRLVEFWPVLLILLGISLIWGREIPRWFALVMVLIMLSIVVLLALNYRMPIPGPYASAIFTFPQVLTPGFSGTMIINNSY